MLAWFSLSVLGIHRRVRFFCGDEARFGLKTVSGRKITARESSQSARCNGNFRQPTCMASSNRKPEPQCSMSSRISTPIASKSSST